MYIKFNKKSSPFGPPWRTGHIEKNHAGGHVIRPACTETTSDAKCDRGKNKIQLALYLGIIPVIYVIQVPFARWMFVFSLRCPVLSDRLSVPLALGLSRTLLSTSVFLSGLIRAFLRPYVFVYGHVCVVLASGGYVTLWYCFLC